MNLYEKIAIILNENSEDLSKRTNLIKLQLMYNVEEDGELLNLMEDLIEAYKYDVNPTYFEELIGKKPNTNIPSNYSQYVEYKEVKYNNLNNYVLNRK